MVALAAGRFARVVHRAVVSVQKMKTTIIPELDSRKSGRRPTLSTSVAAARAISGQYTSNAKAVNVTH